MSAKTDEILESLKSLSLLEASELVKQFKLEMGVGDTSGSKEEPQLDVPEKESETGGKTIGRERTQ